MTPRVVVLADDLTGAMECAAPFAERGIDAGVLAVPGRPAEPARVLSVNLACREADDDDARELVAAALRRHAAELVLLKIDSTLRGPVRGIVDAAAAVGEIVFCPANPLQGRTVEGGRVLVHGTPLEDTEFRRSGRLADYAPAAFARDARDLDALRALARELVARPRPAVVSGGLVAALAEALGGPSADPLAGLRLPAGPILVVAGSGSEVARVQLDRLEPADDLLVLRSPAPGAALAPEVAHGLARRAVEALAAARPRALFLTGGETALRVLELLPAGPLAVLGNRPEGVVNAVLPPGPLLVATKPGAFGGPDTIARWVLAVRAVPD
jgi:D-threonate/D-erythronate kinase